MSCQYCNCMGSHHKRCPNYTAPSYMKICQICEQVIEDGEGYIKKLDNEYAHYDCVNVKEVVEFCNGEIGTMEY